TGIGSTFTLELPQAAQQSTSPGIRRSSGNGKSEQPLTVHEATPAFALPEPLRPEPPATARGRSILVIEDDPRFAEIVAMLARELGFGAAIASSADEALVQAVKEPPDGIVLDMKLPDHSGLSVLDRLKRDSRTRHIPVHVISVANYTRTALEM